MTNYSNWYPLCGGYINAYLEMRDNLESVLIGSNNTGAVISVISDSPELLRLCQRYLTVVEPDRQPDYYLAYLLKTPDPLPTPRGLDGLKRYSSDNAYNDAAVDSEEKVILYAGIRHFGLLKSLISGLQSFSLSKASRQGIHAAALEIDGRGVLIAGGAESGKSNLTLRLLKGGGRISTEDWCDLMIDHDNKLRAIGVDTNISFNLDDLPDLISNYFLDRSFLNKERVPHGHRNKIIADLHDMYSEQLVPEIAISTICLISDVTGMKKIVSPDPKWLYTNISAVSLHNPFCFPFDTINSSSLWESLGNFNIQNAKYAIDARYKFALHLSKVIAEKRYSLIIVPETHEISIEDKELMIRKGLEKS